MPTERSRRRPFDDLLAGLRMALLGLEVVVDAEALDDATALEAVAVSVADAPASTFTGRAKNAPALERSMPANHSFDSGQPFGDRRAPTGAPVYGTRARTSSRTLAATLFIV